MVSCKTWHISKWNIYMYMYMYMYRKNKILLYIILVQVQFRLLTRAALKISAAFNLSRAR
jgi:hypothetical protein